MRKILLTSLLLTLIVGTIHQWVTNSSAYTTADYVRYKGDIYNADYFYSNVYRQNDNNYYRTTYTRDRYYYGDDYRYADRRYDYDDRNTYSYSSDVNLNLPDNLAERARIIESYNARLDAERDRINDRNNYDYDYRDYAAEQREREERVRAINDAAEKERQAYNDRYNSFDWDEYYANEKRLKQDLIEREKQVIYHNKRVDALKKPTYKKTYTKKTWKKPTHKKVYFFHTH